MTGMISVIKSLQRSKKHMNKNNYELTVLVNNKPLKQYFHKGKFYIESRNGVNYTIKLKNHSHKRIMAVFSVDGVDTLKSGPAAEAQSGYIVNPYSSTEITGYRIDDNSVAKFQFSDGVDSYSTQVDCNFDKKKIDEVKQGKRAPSKNNGILGIRVWEEKEVKEIPVWKTTVWNQPPKKKDFYTSPRYGDVINYFRYSGSCTTGSLNGGWTYNPMNTRQDVNQFGELSAIDRIGIDTIMDTCCEGPIGGGTSTSAMYCSSAQPEKMSRKRQIYASNQLYVGGGLVGEGSDSNALLKGGEFVMAANVVPNFSMGTQWGQQTEDKVVRVNFEKAETYIDLEVYYLPKEEMIRIGIDFENTKKAFVTGYPQAFGEDEYCKKPIGWEGQ